MNEIKKINLLYLITVLVLLGASYLPLDHISDNMIVLLLVSQLIILFPSLIYWWYTKKSYKALVGFRKIKLSTAALIVIFTFVMIPVMGFINTLSRFFAVDATTDTMTKIADGNPFIVALFGVAVVPAVLEESVYRGIFFQEYRKANPKAAIFLSALLFAMLHGNFNQFSYAFFMGIIFSLIIEATDSIASTMLMHFIINGNSVVLMYLLPKLGNGQPVEELINQTEGFAELSIGQTLAFYGPQVLVCCVIGYLLYMAIANSCHRKEHITALFTTDRGHLPGRKLFTLPLLAALFILLFSMILLELVSRSYIM